MNNNITNTNEQQQQDNKSETSNKLKEIIDEYNLTIELAKKNNGIKTDLGKSYIQKANKLKNLYNQLISQQSTTKNNTSNTTTTTTSSSNTNNINNLIKESLTTDQSKQYEKLLKNFQLKANLIKKKHTELKKKIELNINNKELTNTLFNNLKNLKIDYTKLYENFQLEKKNFYINCAKKNNKLNSILTTNTTPQPTTTTPQPTTTTNNNTTQSTPQPIIPPPYELNSNHVLSRKKLLQLTNELAIDELNLSNNTNLSIDLDVQDLLIDLADDFVKNLINFSARLANHRNSNIINLNDLQLNLNKNYNLIIPGFKNDLEFNSINNYYPTNEYDRIKNRRYVKNNDSDSNTTTTNTTNKVVKRKRK